MPDRDVDYLFDHVHADGESVNDCLHVSCVKRRSGFCGSHLCFNHATYKLVHKADLATLDDNDAGTESIAKGFPVLGAKIQTFRTLAVTVELACNDHVDALLAGARLLLDDIEAVRIAPESHGERRGT